MRAEPLTPRVSRRLAARVRLEMSGRGFALVDTPPFEVESFPGPRRSVTLEPFHGRRSGSLPALERYGRWLERLVIQALPDELLALAALEYRCEPAGSSNRGVDLLHADGSYLRSVYTPFGRPTVYRSGKVERPVPRGQTLLMTAQNRTRARGVPCTLHRRPGPGPERVVVVGTFEPP